MTITKTEAWVKLLATADSVGTNVSNDVKIGVDKVFKSFTGADIAYSFTLASTIIGDSVTYNMETGACSAAAGSPTITDGDGLDFEGIALPTMVTIFAYLFETPSGNTGVVSTSGGGGRWPDVSFVKNTYMMNMILDGASDAGSCTFTFDTAGDQIKFTAIGRSS